MQFTRALRSRIKSGEITTSIRIWRSARVASGRRYRLDEGFVRIDTIREIGLEDVTPAMARESGFLGVIDLLKVARHGAGSRVFLIGFTYEDI